MSAFVASPAAGMRLRHASAWAGASVQSRPRSPFIPGRPRIQRLAPTPRARPGGGGGGGGGGGALRAAPKAMMGGGGFLGVGPAEVVVIVAVGWLVLGPEKLYALARDSGKILGQLRSSADEARSTFKEALDLEVLEAELKSGVREGEQQAAAAAAASSATKAAPVEPDDAAVDDAGLADMLREDAPVAAAADAAPADAALQSEPVAKAGPPAEAEAMPRAAFLNQLRRVADTEQVAPSETPGDAADQNAGFLDQLRRVGDPGQTAPAEGVGDDVPQEVAMEGATEEELEIERLERQYIEARRKLEERRRSTGSSDGAER